MEYKTIGGRQKLREARSEWELIQLTRTDRPIYLRVYHDARGNDRILIPANDPLEHCYFTWSVEPQPPLDQALVLNTAFFGSTHFVIVRSSPYEPLESYADFAFETCFLPGREYMPDKPGATLYFVPHHRHYRLYHDYDHCPELAIDPPFAIVNPTMLADLLREYHQSITTRTER